MSNPYMPRKDGEALRWMRAFVEGLGNRPSSFMVAAADVQALTRAVNEYEQAYLAAKNPESRTRGTVNTKNQTRNAAENICAVWYTIIKCNHAVSDQDKIDIGVRPENRARRRINCPQESPLLDITGSTPGVQHLRFRGSPGRRAKPFGAAFLELRVAITDGDTGAVEQAQTIGFFTTNPIAVRFEPKDDRRKATHFARWVSRRGETGPWSLPKSMSIAA